MNILHFQATSPPTTTCSTSSTTTTTTIHYNFKHRSHLGVPSRNRKILEMKTAAQLRSQFAQLLSSRRSTGQGPEPEESRGSDELDSLTVTRREDNLLTSIPPLKVPRDVKPAKPVKEPLYQGPPPPKCSEAMESCPKADIPNFKQLLNEENLYLTTEQGDQGCLPVLILSMKESRQSKRPAIVFLHSTNKCKEWLRPLLEAYASRGYIAVAIDSRYHGERAKTRTTYENALVSSWKRGDTMPFIFDTVWDLVKLADYLTSSARDDIDHSKIGITGESFGGMHAWFAAFLDTRYSVVVPIIGVQGFHWAIKKDKWKARVDSIRSVFEEARNDLGKGEIDKEVVEEVWDRIAPGLTGDFDSDKTVPLIAPRPLLILNGAKDPRCPKDGLAVTISETRRAYEEAGCSDNFKEIFEAGIGHEMTSSMVRQASDWFDKYLKP